MDAKAKYPFAIKISLHGDIASGNIVCPCHEAKIAECADGKTVEVAENGFMNRDFVLVVDELAGNSHAIWAEDENNFMACTSFCPKLPEAEISPIALKILVDCSGSMSGDSMIEARNGLGKILALLRPSDYVSYSRFGSHVKHMHNTLMPCYKASLQREAARTENRDLEKH